MKFKSIYLHIYTFFKGKCLKKIYYIFCIRKYTLFLYVFFNVGYIYSNYYKRKYFYHTAPHNIFPYNIIIFKYLYTFWTVFPLTYFKRTVSQWKFNFFFVKFPEKLIIFNIVQLEFFFFFKDAFIILFW